MPFTFRTDLYVRIYLDRLLVRNVRTGQSVEVRPPGGFSHPRALIGKFTVAEPALKQAVAQLRGRMSLATRILLHPCERVEGGLNEIEERVFHELGRGAGANKVVQWLGAELDDAGVIARL